MNWEEAHQQLTQATCMWQDLDGFHIGEVPTEMPYTSILWAWSESTDGMVAYRLRLDRADDQQLVYFAGRAVGAGSELHDWGDLGQVAAARAAANVSQVPDPTRIKICIETDDGSSVPAVPFLWQR